MIYKQGLIISKAVIVISFMISGCAMKVDQPELGLTQLPPLQSQACDVVIEEMDNALIGLIGETIDANKSTELRILNLDQLECLTDRYVNCQAEYEGCRTTVNGLEERFNTKE